VKLALSQTWKRIAWRGLSALFIRRRSKDSRSTAPVNYFRPKQSSWNTTCMKSHFSNTRSRGLQITAFQISLREIRYVAVRLISSQLAPVVSKMSAKRSNTRIKLKGKRSLMRSTKYATHVQYKIAHVYQSVRRSWPLYTYTVYDDTDEIKRIKVHTLVWQNTMTAWRKYPGNLSETLERSVQKALGQLPRMHSGLLGSLRRIFIRELEFSKQQLP